MPTVNLVHPVAGLSEPRLGATVGSQFLEPTSLTASSVIGNFLKLEHDYGYVPAAVCEPWAVPPISGALQQCSLIQPVLLYARPEAGGQFPPVDGTNMLGWMVEPTEALGVLGRSEQFLLVQRLNGHIGYVPIEIVRDHAAMLSQPRAASKNSVVKSIGWIVLGGSWMVPNWLATAGILAFFPGLPDELRPIVGLGVVAAGVVLLWLSKRRLMARSFAGGAMLCYAFLHLVSFGWLTLWRA